MTHRNCSRKNRLFILNISLLILLITVGILYLSQINLISSYSFKIKELRDKLNDLKITNEQTEQGVTSLESIENIYRLSVDSEMVKIVQIDYLVPLETSVAVKK